MSAATEVATRKPSKGNGTPVIVQHDGDEDFLTRMARDKSIDAVKLREVWTVRKDIEATRARTDFYAAMARAQGEFPIIGRDARDEQTKSLYARLETVWEICAPVWTRHGFSVKFDNITNADGTIRPTCIVSHAGGHVETTYGPDTPPDNAGAKGTVNKTMVQANQSTVTYVKRGLLCSAMGIVTKYDDDDGQTSARTTGEPRQTDRQTTGQGEPRQTGASWFDRAKKALDAVKTAEQGMTILAQALPDATTGTEVSQLAHYLKKRIDAQPVAYRTKARALFKSRMEQLSPKADARQGTASDNPSDAKPGTMRAAAADVVREKAKQGNGEHPVLTTDEQWAEDRLSELLLMTEMGPFLTLVQHADTQSTMRRLSTANRPLFERMKREFEARQTHIAREAVR